MLQCTNDGADIAPNRKKSGTSSSEEMMRKRKRLPFSIIFPSVQWGSRIKHFLLNDFENTQYTHVIDTNMEKTRSHNSHTPFRKVHYVLRCWGSQVVEIIACKTRHPHSNRDDRNEHQVFSLIFQIRLCLLCMSWLEVYLESGSLLKAFIFIFRNYWECFKGSE